MSQKRLEALLNFLICQTGNSTLPCLQRASVERILVKDRPEVLTIVVEKVELNPVLDEARFKLPA